MTFDDYGDVSSDYCHPISASLRSASALCSGGFVPRRDRSRQAQSIADSLECGGWTSAFPRIEKARIEVACKRLVVKRSRGTAEHL